MSDPAQKTFDYLASSANEFALPVLLCALDTHDDDIRARAVAAILRRGQKRGFAELILRYDALPDDQRELVAGSASRMRDALKDAVEKGKPNVRRNAIRLIQSSSAWSLAEPLLALVIEGGEIAREALDTVLVLVDRLRDELSAAAGGHDDSSGRNHARMQVVGALAAAVGRPAAGSFLNELVQSVLVLGRADDAAIRGLLTDDNPAVVDAVWKLLEHCRHPGAIELACHLLVSRLAADRLISLVERRDDPEFVLQLLRSLPNRFSNVLSANFRRIGRLAWIDPADLRLDWVPPGMQGKLVEMVSASGLDRDVILAVQQWVLRNGSVIGRIAAIEALAASDHGTLENAIAEGLESEDAEVQAWATSQLREQNVPQAFSLLIERLDSPLEPVRIAARDELESFDLHRMLELFNHLKPHICERAGRLIRKIDPDTVQRLETELRSPLRTRRIRAVHAARAMGLHADVAPVLLEMLRSDDHTIQRAAIDAVADLPLREVEIGLLQLCRDEDPRIRRAAQSALQQRAGAMPAQPDLDEAVR